MNRGNRGGRYRRRGYRGRYGGRGRVRVRGRGRRGRGRGGYYGRGRYYGLGNILGKHVKMKQRDDQEHKEEIEINEKQQVVGKNLEIENKNSLLKKDGESNEKGDVVKNPKKKRKNRSRKTRRSKKKRLKEKARREKEQLEKKAEDLKINEKEEKSNKGRYEKKFSRGRGRKSEANRRRFGGSALSSRKRSKYENEGTKRHRKFVKTPVDVNFDKDKAFMNTYDSESDLQTPLSVTTTTSNNSFDISQSTQREVMIRYFKKNLYECSICYELIKRDDAIWNCCVCYNVFHLGCIRKWSESTKDEQKKRVVLKGRGFNCPICSTNYEKVPKNYFCFCGKTKDPETAVFQLPHSCGDDCGKKMKTCPHTCSEKCHPGPCPDCKSTKLINCFCTKKTFRVNCSGTGSEQKTCGDKCGKLLNCGIHTCQQICHDGDCKECADVNEEKCYCGKELCKRKCQKNRVIFDPITEEERTFSCNKVCGKILGCVNHYCKELCHVGPCDECQLLPKFVKVCNCGKTSLSHPTMKELPESNRKSCVDIIPSCHEKCSKKLICGKHYCKRKCHKGSCNLQKCYTKVFIACRCNGKTLPLPCYVYEFFLKTKHLKMLEKDKIGEIEKLVNCSLEEYTDYFKKKNTKLPFFCERSCKKFLNCGRHVCKKKCCPFSSKKVSKAVRNNPEYMYLHFCPKVCERKMKCQNHRCDLPCHFGNCPPCQVINNNIIKCKCGKTTINPPKRCGTRIKNCQYQCSIVRKCGHSVNHKCHSDGKKCPPCNERISKVCSGGHKVIKNIACCLKTISCGNRCAKVFRCGYHICNRICHPGKCGKHEMDVIANRKREKFEWIIRSIRGEIACLYQNKRRIQYEGEDIFVNFYANQYNVKGGKGARSIFVSMKKKKNVLLKAKPNISNNGILLTVCENFYSPDNLRRRREGKKISLKVREDPYHKGYIQLNFSKLKPKTNKELIQDYDERILKFRMKLAKMMEKYRNEVVFSCSRRCDKKIETCGHKCGMICHPAIISCAENYEKKNKQCLEKVLISCQCRRIKRKMDCYKAREIYMNIYNKRGRQLNMGLFHFSIYPMLLSCDDECNRIRRNKKLAWAFQVNYTKHEVPDYDVLLKDFASSSPANLKFIENVEREFIGLIKDDSRNAVHFRPMKIQKRTVIHYLSDYFNLTSESFDYEPNKYVCVTKNERSGCPKTEYLLSNVMKDEKLMKILEKKIMEKSKSLEKHEEKLVQSKLNKNRSYKAKKKWKVTSSIKGGAWGKKNGVVTGKKDVLQDLETIQSMRRKNTNGFKSNNPFAVLDEDKSSKKKKKKRKRSKK